MSVALGKFVAIVAVGLITTIYGGLALGHGTPVPAERGVEAATLWIVPASALDDGSAATGEPGLEL